MKRIWVLALLFGAGLSAAIARPGSDGQEVRQAEEARVQAVLRVDRPALERLLADDLTYTHSTGRTQSKAEFIHDLESHELTYVDIRHEDPRVRVYGDAAVITGRSLIKVKSPRTQGQAIDLDVRFLNVYAKRNGQWQQVAWQSTRIAPQ